MITLSNNIFILTFLKFNDKTNHQHLDLCRLLRSLWVLQTFIGY